LGRKKSVVVLVSRHFLGEKRGKKEKKDGHSAVSKFEHKGKGGGKNLNFFD